MKDYDKIKVFSYLKLWDVDHFHGWIMPQKLPTNDLKWVEHICEFDKIFRKMYNEESHEEYFLEVDILCLENLHNLQK